MNLQEVFNFIDFSYYNCVLFIVMFLQEQVKDFLSTVVCFLMSLLGAFCITYINSYGFTFYEAAMLYEALVASSCIVLGLISCKTGLIVFTVSCVSFFVNFVGYWLPNGEFYFWYKSSYGYINIILFEVLVWSCIANSRLKPHIEKLQKYIQNYHKIKQEK